MDKNKIAEIIKNNPHLGYDEMKRQAQDIGIDFALFETAWKDTHADTKKISERTKVIVTALLIFILAVAVYLFKPIYSSGHDYIAVKACIDQKRAEAAKYGAQYYYTEDNCALDVAAQYYKTDLKRAIEICVKYRPTSRSTPESDCKDDLAVITGEVIPQ